MSFQFIENGKIDVTARRRIRSHVMKGKNLGKVRMSSTRKEDGEILCSCENCTADPLIQTGTDHSETKVISVPGVVGTGYSPFTFPCLLQPYMRGLIYQFRSLSDAAVYPKEFCLPMKVRGGTWFQFLRSDGAFFHSLLAMSEVCADSLLGKTEASPRALMHLSHTYRCIKQNLDKDGIPSDSTMAAVMSMAIHDVLRDQTGRSKVHVDALHRMVELRGGIAQFRDNKLLLQKICRADIQYAIYEGSFPHFYWDEFPRKMIQSMSGQSVHQEELCSVANDAQIYDHELRDVLVDLLSVTRLFNDSRTFVRLDPYSYQEILISVCYRLLHHHQLAGDGPKNDNENACYLGLLALATTLLFQYGRSQRLQYGLLAGKLRIIIGRVLSNKLVEETTLLWLLFTGGISVFNTTDWEWLVPQIKALLSSLNIHDWLAARDKIKTLPWIDVAHDKPGKELWQAAVSE